MKKELNEEFKMLVAKLPSLLEQLVNSPRKPWSDLGNIPKKGIYVFFENGDPLYVGRSNRMKKRIKEHGWKSSTHHSAQFAFNLAKKAAEEIGIDIGRRRDELKKDATFARLFIEAKERISRMSIRVVEINDPIIQTNFEVYSSLALGTTQYKDFDTH